MERVLIAATVAILGCSGSPCTAQSPDGGRGSDANQVRDGGVKDGARIVIVVGDGMGRVLERITSNYLEGRDGALSWNDLSERGQLRTSSASGITDSAAAATAMACGVVTYNGRLGIDRHGVSRESIFEVASRLGLSRGIVTTATVSHATLAAFSSHQFDRYDYASIAAEQARATGPTVMFGGGRLDFEGQRLKELRGSGAAVVFDREALNAVSLDAPRVVGLFADGPLPHVAEREDSAEVPDLLAMSQKAIEILERNAAGFVLVVEAARIDRACHDRDLATAVAETVELNETVAMLRAWVRGSDNRTLLVLADHETGGLAIDEVAGRGELSSVRWRWGLHGNAQVGIYGEGRGTDSLVAGSSDHRVIHQIAKAVIEGREPTSLPSTLLADGELFDHRAAVAVQTRVPDASANGSLDGLYVDADEFGVVIGVEGTFSMTSSSLIVLVDRDYGSESGALFFQSLSSPPGDVVDTLIRRFSLDLRPFAGFGADFAIVSVAGIESGREQPFSGAGWRSLRSADGAPVATPTLGVALTYADSVRATSVAATGRARAGAELAIGFDALLEPSEPLAVGAELALFVQLTSVLGSTHSNQALPPLASDSNLDAIAVITLDSNRDGKLDAHPTIRLELRADRP